MPLSTYAAQALLNALFGKAGGSFGALGTPPSLRVALFKDAPAPGDTGAAITAKEADYAGYARVATTEADWNAPAAGVIDNDVEFSFPQATGGSAHCKFAGLVTGATDGELVAWGLLSPSGLKDFTYESEDSEFVVPGHGWSNGTEVRLIKKDGDTALPTGVDEATKYFIVNATADSFQLSLTNGGAAVAISSDGAGRVGVDGSLQVTNNVTPKIAAGNLTLSLK